MKQSGLKNMIVLKNLPSNIIEEAIVILKSNKKIKLVEKSEKGEKFEKVEKVEKIEKNEKNKKVDKQKDSDKNKENYIVKEAEMLISNYISRLEEKKKKKVLDNKKINKRYLKLRNYSILASLIVFVETILLIIK